MKKSKLIVFKTINCILIFVSFLIILSCDKDNTESRIGNLEVDLQNKGIELDTKPYSSYTDEELPEIQTSGKLINPKYDPNGKLVKGEYSLTSGKYRMVIDEALICPADGKYIYFQSRIRTDEWAIEVEEDDKNSVEYPFKIRIYLDPSIDSDVLKRTIFGTLLTEYGFQVIVEIIREGELDNPCMTIDSPEDRSDTIGGLYIGRLISIFE